MKLELWRPPKSWYLSQGFAQNRNSSYAEDGLIGHTGQDWVAPYNAPIPSLCDGVVSWIANKDHPDLNKYRGVFIRAGNYEISYGHLNEIFVTIGQKVSSGDIIGSMGNTGKVYSGGKLVSSIDKVTSRLGTHLHIQGRKILSWSPYVIQDLDNGFNGCLNLEQFYSKYSIDAKPIFLKIIKLISDFLKGR